MMNYHFFIVVCPELAMAYCGSLAVFVLFTFRRKHFFFAIVASMFDQNKFILFFESQNFIDDQKFGN